MKRDDMFRRIGKVTFSGTLVFTRPKDVMEILKDCLVVKCVDSLFDDTFTYTFISDKLKEVPEGQVVPEYIVVAAEDANSGAKTITFVGD